MKKVVIILITIVFSATAYAESSVWKLTSGNNNFYIAGSCHVLSKSDYPLPEEFELAYENVDQVIFETDLEALMSPEIQQLLMGIATYPGDDTLEKKLSKKSYATLAEYCNHNAIPISIFQKFKPWMVTMTLLAIELEKNGISSADGLELYLSEKTKRDGKNTGGLEDIQEHIEIISSFEEALDESIIENFVQEIEELHVTAKDLIKSWKAGDEAKINEYLSGRLRKESPKLYERIIVDRNRRWISPLEDLINSGERTLVVVGVGHLAGEDSVINLLKSKGYKIEKLNVELHGQSP
jgi:hypothetical protein